MRGFRLMMCRGCGGFLLGCWMVVVGGLVVGGGGGLVIGGGGVVGEVLVADEVVGAGELFVGEVEAFVCLGDELVRRRVVMDGRVYDFMDPDELERLYPMKDFGFAVAPGGWRESVAPGAFG